MNKGKLSDTQRRRWRSLYNAGWRVVLDSEYGLYVVKDSSGQVRSSPESERYLAVRELVGRD